MNFLDSWVWLEYVFDGDEADAAERVIQEANSADVGGLVTPTVTAEVAYRVRAAMDDDTAEDAVQAIRDFEHVECVPLVDELGEYAAQLRHKYYDRRERELSYADAIHLAVASTVDDCDRLYTGDPDFEGVDEVDVVVL